MATANALTRASADCMPVARSRVNVAMPQRLGGYVPRNPTRISESTAS
jgi:hypothetical protein